VESLWYSGVWCIGKWNQKQKSGLKYEGMLFVKQTGQTYKLLYFGGTAVNEPILAKHHVPDANMIKLMER
jgi:hypothetical protein